MHDYHDTATSVLAASLAKRAPDTPASDSPTPPHPPHVQFAYCSEKSLTCRPITNALLPGTRSRALELNRCSTTRASIAGKRTQPLPAPTAP